ncbi:MAG: energy transducer TonB [Bacteroidales bacterium]|jgi:protein TonB
MKRKNEKVPGFDEIIFENRNKEYGAYDLRKKYLPATFCSLIGSVALFSGVIIAVSLSTERDATAEKHEIMVVVGKFDNSIPDINKLKPDVPPVLKPITMVKPYVAPIIVDKLDSNDVTMAAVPNFDSTRDRPVDILIKPDVDPVEIVTSESEYPVIVQEMPEFPGGQTALLKYINDNINYPASAIDNGIEGKIILRFVVSTDGSVKRIEILRSVDPLLDQEAVRVISQMPKWKPGKNNGTPAAVWFSVPVTFRIKKN